MAITAKVIQDSICKNAPRLTTMLLRYPRFIHPEFLVHRVFSRNASSSRAIPVKKMLEQVMTDPAIPIHFGLNIPGMSAREELDDTRRIRHSDKYGEYELPSVREEAINEWLRARNSAVKHVQVLLDLGLHKQVANRILEPWMHIEVVVTATDWANFYALRDHPDAQPEIQELAKQMIIAHNASNPTVLYRGDSHTPFVTAEEKSKLLLRSDIEFLAEKVSAARCARVSFLNHDGTAPNIEEDLKLFERLMGGDVKHASPTEHQAFVSDSYLMPSKPFNEALISFSYPSNLRDWVQFRQLINGNVIKEYKGFK